MTPVYLETWGIAPTGAPRRFDLRGVHTGVKVAVHAPNGSGKSILLASIGGVLYDQIGGYNGGSSFRDCVIGANGGGQLWFTVAGDLYRARRQVTGSRHTAYLHRVVSAAEPLDFRVGDEGLVELVGAEYEPLPSDAGGLVSEFADALSGIGVMDADLWFVGPYAHQKGLGDFWGLKTVSERRAILAKMMGAHRFEGLSVRARDQRKALDKVVKVIADDVSRLEEKEKEAYGDRAEWERLHPGVRRMLAPGMTGDEPEFRGLQGRVDVARAAVTVAAEEREASASTLDLRRQTETAIREKFRGLEEEGRTLERERAAVATQLEDTTGKLRATEAEIATAEADAADVDGLRTKSAEADDLHERCTQLQADHRVAVAEVQAAQARVDDLAAQLAELPEAPDDIDNRRAEAEAVIAGATAMEAEHRDLMDRHAALAVQLAEAQVTAREIAAAEDTVTRTRAELMRLSKAAGLVDEVPCGGRAWNLHQFEEDNRLDCSKCQLLVQAQEALSAIPGAGAEVAKAEEAEDILKHQQATAAALQREIADLDATLAQAGSRLAAITAARAEVAELSKATAEAEKRGVIVARLEEARGKLSESKGVKDVLATQGKEAAVALVALAPGIQAAQVAAHLRAQLEKATSAAQAIGRLEGDRVRLAAEVVNLQGRAAEIAHEMTGHSAVLAEVRDDLHARAQATQAAAQAHQAAEAALSDARRTLDRLDGRLAALEEDLAHLPALRALLADATQTRDDERLIEEGFSVKGVQGLLVDLAGPAFTERMNRLLRTLAEAIGEQPWEVKLDTYDPDAPPTKRERADLLVKAPGEVAFRPPRVSPGQQGPLSLAMRGASILTMEEEHGISVPLCIADELDGPLDGQRRRGFVPMLNACGARTWLVISHHEDVRSQCEHLFEVGDGVDGGVRKER